MSPLAIDPQPQLTEPQLQPNDSMFNHGTLARNDDSALSDEIGPQECHNDSFLPPSLETEVRRLLKQKPLAAGAISKHVPYDPWGVADEAPNPSLDSHDVFPANGNAPFEKHGHKGSVSSGKENLSELSLEGGYEISGSVKPPYLNVVCSECELGFDDLDKESASTSDVPDAWSSDNDSDVQRPVVVSWKEPAVVKSEIPPSVVKPSKSDVSDLGDRYSYANLNAPGRRSSIAWSALDDTDEHLDLQDRFFEALVRPHEEKKGFFPRGLLSTLVTDDCVFDELSRCLKDTHNPNQIKTYAEIICKECPQPPEEDDDRPPKIKSFKKIFAILVLIEKTSSIPKFLDEDLNDLHLPLTKLRKGRNGSRFELRISSNQSKRLECFGNWTSLYLKNFEEWQWTTVSPFFYKGSCRDVEHFPLQPSVMLPFTIDSRRSKESEYRTEIEGGYSRVFQVHIHPDHHSFDTPKLQNQCFAVKRLNSPSKEDFKQEVEMLKMFSDDTRYPHLISLLATYEQFGVYFLVFPWADGDLNVFWSQLKPKPSFDMETVKWVAKQCEGIAHGLVKIHHYQTTHSNCQTDSHNHDGTHEPRYGRHGDLKPENILWFSGSDGGILKISDFGLSEYSTNHSKSYRPKSGVRTSMSYRPPECDLKGGKIGQSYDIWTLGCLYLEFITWLLGGWELVKAFEKKRMSFDPMWYDMHTDTFFEIVECRRPGGPGAFAAMVKPTVKDFMEYLHTHESCTEFLHEFINMIKLDMLIVKSNNPDEPGRITSDQVNAKLTAMIKQSEDPKKGPDYVCRPAPWCSLSQNSEDVVEIDTDSAAEVLNYKRFRHYNGPIQERSYAKMLEVPGSISRRGSNRSSHH